MHRLPLPCLALCLLAACAAPANPGPTAPGPTAQVKECKHEVIGSNIPRRGCVEQSEQDQRNVDDFRDLRSRATTDTRGSGP
jgi:hypothetical protein